MSDKSENEEYHTETVGEIGDVELTIRLEGDEELAGVIYADLVARADEIKQMVDHDIPPNGTETPMTVDWYDYLSAEEQTSIEDHAEASD